MRRFLVFLLNVGLSSPCATFGADAHLYVQLGHSGSATSAAFSPEAHDIPDFSLLLSNRLDGIVV
jgi:hypothetical protein